MELVHPSAYVGATGLERSYDDELRGALGVRLVKKDKTEHVVGSDLRRVSPVHGVELRTTIDAELQSFLYTRLASRCLELSSPGGSAVVIDLRPDSEGHTQPGAVRASVGYPGYHPGRMLEPGYREEQNRRYTAKSGWERDRPTRQKGALRGRRNATPAILAHGERRCPSLDPSA